MNILGPEWLYQVTINQKDWPAVQIWCEENIGEFDQQWYKLGIDIAVLDSYETTWYFKKQEHAMLFSLKWC